MVDVKCLVCGKSLKIPPYIDPDDYDGQLVCHKCKSLLYIKLAASKVKKYRVVERSVVEKNLEHDIKVITAVPRPDYSKEAEGDVKT